MALKDWISNSPTSATPAALATGSRGEPPKPAPNPLTVASAASVAKVRDFPSTAIPEIARLLREMAKLENWSAAELADKLDQMDRMAPVNVVPVLKEIRRTHAAALAVWPNPPASRSDIRLCKLEHVELTAITGGKS